MAGTGRVRFVPWPAEKKRIDIGSFYSDSTQVRARHRLGAARDCCATAWPRTVAFYREHLPHYRGGRRDSRFVDLEAGGRCGGRPRGDRRGSSSAAGSCSARSSRRSRRSSPRPAARPHAVGVGTGTDALALALRALGIGPGDEVITSPLSAAYTALAIMMVGARPVFADIDPERLTLDPRTASAAITPRTRAIMPVHLYGQPADMPALMALAKRHGLAVVEDCCQAHLATCEGRPVGSFGDAAAYSFYPTKNLGALGDGGAVTTADEQLAAAHAAPAQRRTDGSLPSPGIRRELAARRAAGGRSSRAPPLAAANGRANGARSRRSTGGVSRTPRSRVPPQCDPGHVYHLFPVLSSDRAAVQAHLRSRGVETLIHYPVPIPRQPALASESPAECPVADRIAAEVLSLPLRPGLTLQAIDAVAVALHEFHAAV